jgi:hypothetical protein
MRLPETRVLVLLVLCMYIVTTWRERYHGCLTCLLFRKDYLISIRRRGMQVSP